MNGLTVVGNLVKELPKGLSGKISKGICSSEKVLPNTMKHWYDQALSDVIKVCDKSAIEKDLAKYGFKSIEEAFDALAKDSNADVPHFIKKAFHKSRISFDGGVRSIRLCGDEANFHYGWDDEVNDLFPWGAVTPFEQGEKGSCW